jgi:hypothetical protein
VQTKIFKYFQWGALGIPKLMVFTILGLLLVRLMWALPFGYPTLAYLLWPNKGTMRIIAAQDGSIRRLQWWKDRRRRIFDEQGKETSNKERID